METKENGLDFTYITEVTGGDQSIINDTINIFLKNAPMQVLEIIDLLRSAETEKSRTAIHKLRSSVNVFFNEDMKKLLEALEDHLDEKPINDQVQNEFMRFNDIFLQGIEELEKRIS